MTKSCELRYKGMQAMASKFLNMLKNHDWILADGATGTNLFKMGLEAGDAPEFWKETQPERIVKLYCRTVEADSDLSLLIASDRKRRG